MLARVESLASEDDRVAVHKRERRPGRAGTGARGCNAGDENGRKETLHNRSIADDVAS